MPREFLQNENNITFTWNLDGVPLFKSSKMNIWPLYLIINELPYSLRIKKENSIIAGIWFGQSKPEVNLFMSVFEKELEKLYNGIDVQVPNLEYPLKVRGPLISGTCDLPAKALFLNMHQFNGKYGCMNCNFLIGFELKDSKIFKHFHSAIKCI